MKKTYMKPLTEARELELEAMVCASGTFDDTLDTTNTIGNSNDILSKENNFDLWGLDDED